MSGRPARADYRAFVDVPTRWMDNDVYGHVNNVVYYAYFDTAVNRFLIDRGVLDIHGGEVIGFAVESKCTYLAPVAFPDALQAGLRVGKLGRSSVRYELAIFREGEDAAAAHGYFVHVYVERSTQQPRPLPDPLRAALTPLVVG